MSLSKRALETLIDLVEIKLSCVEVYDREDANELAGLEHCRRELLLLAGLEVPEPTPVVSFPQRGRGRQPKRRAAI